MELNNNCMLERQRASVEQKENKSRESGQELRKIIAIDTVRRAKWTFQSWLRLLSSWRGGIEVKYTAFRILEVVFEAFSQPAATSGRVIVQWLLPWQKRPPLHRKAWIWDISSCIYRSGTWICKHVTDARRLSQKKVEISENSGKQVSRKSNLFRGYVVYLHLLAMCQRPTSAENEFSPSNKEKFGFSEFSMIMNQGHFWSVLNRWKNYSERGVSMQECWCQHWHVRWQGAFV